MPQLTFQPFTLDISSTFSVKISAPVSEVSIAAFPTFQHIPPFFARGRVCIHMD
jgi:hypothetical protein